MKYAMWKVDPEGTYRFSDRTNPGQKVLFKPEPDYSLLKKLIIEEFRNKMVSIEQLEEFVVVKTPFRETHYKRQILIPMEEAKTSEIEVSNRKKRYTYPPRTIIKFL